MNLSKIYIFKRGAIIGFSFLLSSFIGWSQPSTIKGFVTDSNDVPIPYAALKIKNKPVGAACNYDGYFKISVNKNDTLQVSALGYYTDEFRVNDFLDKPLTYLKLEEKAIVLNELVVNDKNEEFINIGITKPKGIGLIATDQHYRQNALLLMYNESMVGKLIASVSITLSEGYETPFRLRIYNVADKGKPGIDLLNESKIVKASKKRVNINLSQYGINLPKNGIFIAVEIIESSPAQNGFTKNKGEKKKPTITFFPYLKSSYLKKETDSLQWWTFDPSRQLWERGQSKLALPAISISVYPE